jgi:transaldolase
MGYSMAGNRNSNPLLALQEQGQSVWYDNISRVLMDSGELKNMIEQDGIRGVTSNPTIFEKAILQTHGYDESIRALVERGAQENEIYESLVVADIQRAADLFITVFEGTQGADGYVSLEVSPRLAYQTTATIAEARRLWARVRRPNLMIKVPATPEGILAVEALIAEGINVNVTLMFSMNHYIQVAEAYLRGLTKLADSGRPLSVASVASFFVSRVDTLVDQRLEKALQESTSVERAQISDLLGKTAVANTRLVYQKFKELFSTRQFESLKQRGARVQRPLWASTSTKNPRYRDVIYAEELIGPDTVNTMPPATVNAFRDHGLVRPSLEESLEGSQRILEQLSALRIDLDEVTSQLQREGVKAFADSFETLMQAISSKLLVFREV